LTRRMRALLTNNDPYDMRVIEALSEFGDDVLKTDKQGAAVEYEREFNADLDYKWRYKYEQLSARHLRQLTSC
jgi:hypothetical protein